MAKDKATYFSGGIALQASGLPEVTSGVVPEWIHILPAGEARTVDGRGPYIAKNPGKIIAASSTEVQTVDVTYNVMPVSRSDELETGQDMIDFVHEAVAKIEGLVDEANTPLPWTSEVAAKFWDLPFVFCHIRDAYVDALNEARAKN